MGRFLGSTQEISREDRLAKRRGGIGGSDAAAAAGVNRFCSRLSLWAEKTGRSEAKPDNPRMRLGRDLEGYVIDRFTEKTGKQVRRLNAVYAHDRFDFIVAELDGEIVGENAGLECKTANFSFSKLPQTVDELPAHFVAQCRHYINVMGYDKMYLAVLDFASGEPAVFEIPKDDAECSALLDAEVAFWNDHVLTGIPPEPDGSDSAEETLRQLAAPVREDCAELDDCADEADELYRIRDTIRGLEGEERRLRQVIIAKLDGCAAGNAGKYRVSLSQQNRRAVDSKLLKKDFPDVFEKCSRVSAVNVFKITERECGDGVC